MKRSKKTKQKYNIHKVKTNMLKLRFTILVPGEYELRYLDPISWNIWRIE